jgi:hypothetical protein
MQAFILGVVATLLNVAYFVAFDPEDFGHVGIVLLLLLCIIPFHTGAALWVAVRARWVKRLLLPH